MTHLSLFNTVSSLFVLSLVAMQTNNAQAMRGRNGDLPKEESTSPKKPKPVQSWDATKSMTPALPQTIGVSETDPEQVLIGKEGPSPSNQALVVMHTSEGDFVLLCKDYDPRLVDGKYRPTHGALKASFGFGLPKDHSFESSFQALVKGPANTALYNLFSKVDLSCVQTGKFAYSEGGKEWGPVSTIPVFISVDFDMANKLVAQLNQISQQTFDNRKNDFEGRFRDFTLLPLKALLSTGNDQPAVLDESKLEMIMVDGVPTKLWDESQMRKNLLPHVEAFLSSLKK
jgi:hypothetical protein